MEYVVHISPLLASQESHPVPYISQKVCYPSAPWEAEVS